MADLLILSEDLLLLAIQTSFTGISTEINSRTYYLGQSFNEGVAQPEVEKYTGNIIYVDNSTLYYKIVQSKRRYQNYLAVLRNYVTGNQS